MSTIREELKETAKEAVKEKFKEYMSPSGKQLKRNIPKDIKQAVFLLNMSILGDSNVEILGEYIKAKEKIKIRCKKCPHEWEASPDSLLRGHGCPKCAGNSPLDVEEFKKDLLTRGIHLVHYIGNVKDQSTFQCVVDGHVWKTAANSVRAGTGCPKCAGNIPLNIENVKEELLVRNIKLVDYANNSKGLSTFQCLIDKYFWKTSVNKIRSGTGCPKCAKTAPIDQELLKQELLSRNIYLLEYSGSVKTKSTFKCGLDNHTWQALAASVKSGTGCPKCAKNYKVDTEEFKQELILRNIELINYAGNTRLPSVFRCLKDNYEWSTSAENVRGGTGCPKCANQVFNILYLLYDQKSKTYKIGVTQSIHSLPTRIKRIAPENLDLVHYWEIPNNAYAVEQHVHKKLKRYNVYNTYVYSGNTEFFDLSHVENVVDYIDKLVISYNPHPAIKGKMSA